MCILVAKPLGDRLVRSGLGDMIVYRPDLATRPDWRSVLVDCCPDAVVVGGRLPDGEALDAWRLAAGSRTPVIIRAGADPEVVFAGRCGVEIREVEGEEPEDRDLAALIAAEAHVNHCRTAARLRRPGFPDAVPNSRANRVLLVGAGIVNLITAWELAQGGYQLEVIDAAPNPGTRPDWRLLGATHGGGNARMFSLTEADNYNEKGSRIYSGMDTVLRRRIREGGWLAGDPSADLPAEKLWLNRFHAVPPWMAEAFTRDIYSVNRESMDLWEALRGNSPQLFDDVGFVEGLLRVYSESAALDAAASIHRRLGSLQRVLTRSEVAARHPAFRDACASGEIAGGLEVVGFTLNVHNFAARLIAALELRGVVFRWNVTATRIDIGSDGLVRGLETSAAVSAAHHYVLSPGAGCGNWLAGVRTSGSIQGVFGLWLTLPNLQPRLTRSVKLHREGHVGEDSNITLAHDDAGLPILLLGSGYGFCGSRPVAMDSPDVESLFEAVEGTARRFLPAGYLQAVGDGTIRTSRRACIRPFTATGLGIFEVLGTRDGGCLVITTGHNTGGFTQSPSVAKAVLATLGGQRHPMQEIYDPDRGFEVRDLDHGASARARAAGGDVL